MIGDKTLQTKASEPTKGNDIMPSNALVFYVHLHLKSDCVEEWKALVQDVIDNMSHENTFVNCYLLQSMESETLFTLYETWSEPSPQAFIQNQMGKAYRAFYEAKLPTLLETPRSAAILNCLRGWNKQPKI
jgi:quinol monooxygenase YgiN